MKNLVIIVLTLFIITSAKAQDFHKDSILYIDHTEFFVNFPGGDSTLIKYLKENVKYPDSSLNTKIEGRVWASFLVDEEGKISDIKIERSLSNDIDKEVIRVISEMPDWEWSKKLTKRQRKKVRKFIPLKFKL